jgi:hypothetical protein
MTASRYGRWLVPPVRKVDVDEEDGSVVLVIVGAVVAVEV